MHWKCLQKKIKAHYFLSSSRDLIAVHVLTYACQYLCKPSFHTTAANSLDDLDKRVNDIITNEEGSLAGN